MKRIMMSAMVLVILLVSIGGCFVPWHGDGRDGRGGGHDRDGRYDRDGGRTETEVMTETEVGIRKEIRASLQRRL